MVFDGDDITKLMSETEKQKYTSDKQELLSLEKLCREYDIRLQEEKRLRKQKQAKEDRIRKEQIEEQNKKNFDLKIEKKISFFIGSKSNQ